MQKTGLLLLNFFLMQPRTSSLTLNCFCDFDGPVMNKVHGNMASSWQTVLLLEHQTRIRGELNLQSDANC